MLNSQHVCIYHDELESILIEQGTLPVLSPFSQEIQHYLQLDDKTLDQIIELSKDSPFTTIKPTQTGFVSDQENQDNCFLYLFNI